MFRKKIIWGLLLLFCLFGIGRITETAMREEQSRCLGIPVPSEWSWRDDLEYQYVDYSDHILFNGEKAAIDLASSTIYIPQKTDGMDYFWQMKGQLQVTAEGCQPYLAMDTARPGIPSSTSLYILDGNGHFAHYNVVFTELAVVRLEGSYLYTEEETEREVMSGTVTVWTYENPDLERSSAKSALSHWHVRGYTTANMDKKSLKLSLKMENGENRNEAFLGLGKDDDWILNSLSMDDTKLKERVFMALWNDLAAQSSHDLKMSSGEYVEAVINGVYSGLYLLQRRVDAKFLELGREDILLKGANTWSPPSFREGFEIVSSPYDEDTTYSILEDAMTNQRESTISLENFVDLNLMLESASAMDNTGYKNMYYVLRQREEGYRLTFVPWDTDMSWGIVYEDSFQYQYDRSLNLEIQRMESGAMQALHPDLHSRMCSRWQELRQGILSSGHIQGLIRGVEESLTGSGALARDRQCWGLLYGGEDTVENLKRFVEDRLQILDERYAQ